MRFLVAAVLSPVLVLVFSAAFSYDEWPFWLNVTGQMIGSVVAGWTVGRIGRSKGGIAAAAGLGLTWLPVVILTARSIPVRSTIAVLGYLVSATTVAEIVGRRRASTQVAEG
jgi:MFS family permease